MRTKLFAIFFVALSMIAMTGCGTAKPKDPQIAYEDSISHIVAQTLLQQREFVLTANRITLGSSGMLHVNDNLNFILVKGDECTLQLTLNNAMFAPFTAEGKVSNYTYSESKKGEAKVSFRFNGRLGSGTVTITLYKDSDMAMAYIDATFRRGRATFYGPVRSTSPTIIKIPKVQPQTTAE